MKNLLTNLTLAYHPISNQEADWLWTNQNVRDYVRGSKLYMIAQREEVFFVDYDLNKETLLLRFSLRDSKNRVDGLSLDLNQLVGEREYGLDFEMGSKIIRLWGLNANEERESLIEWFTVEKLLMDSWRGRIAVQGPLNHRLFTSFRLLYVGISKKDDSFTRLFDTGHEKRTKILSNESQVRKEARLTDELFIFLFRVEQTHIRIYSLDDSDVDEMVASLLTPPSINETSVVADAEKAYIRILNTQYNTIKYKGYPEGTDGLFNQGLDNYGYFINEDISFYTDAGTVSGGYIGRPDYDPRFGDLILVSGPSVTLAKAEPSLLDSKDSA